MDKQFFINNAFVIKINDRYFSGFSKSGSALTAWSLAGAKMYMPFTDENNEWLNNDLKKLSDKKKEYVVKKITISEQPISN